MNGPRIGGIEPPENTAATPDNQPPPPPAPPLPPAPEIPSKPVEKPRRSSMVVLLTVLALITALGGALCTWQIRQSVHQLRFQTVKSQTMAQTALEKLSALKMPKDVTGEVTSLEISIDKLRAADDAIRKNLADEIQKLSALDNRLTEADRQLAMHLTDNEDALRRFRERTDGRLTNVIAILKNQDRLLHQLILAPPAPVKPDEHP